MKQTPRVSTFLRSMMSYHTTFPSEKEAEESKKQPKVSRYYRICENDLIDIWGKGEQGSCRAHSLVRTLSSNSYRVVISLGSDRLDQ